MRKGLLVSIPLLVILLAVPLIAAVVVTLSTNAAVCKTQRTTTTTDDLADADDPDGPIGGPITGTITLAQANIPTRSGAAGFTSSMPKALSTSPDLLTLNEQRRRTLTQIEAAAPGYTGYRPRARAAGPGGEQSMSNVVLWESAYWTKLDAGRVKIVDDDQTYYAGRPVTWDRFATWVLLRRKHDGAVVSVISTHHMTNPARFPRQHGTPALSRPQQYGAGMDALIQVIHRLSAHGPVLVGGDMNSRASYTDRSWSAVAKMRRAGYQWHHHGVDFIFFPAHQGVRLQRGRSGTMTSDHRWVAARMVMNGAVPTGPTAPADGGTREPRHQDPARSPEGIDELRRMRLAPGYPTLTTEQARNAATIARVARDLDVPRRGLQVAIAAAIQESRLRNRPGGDADSGGLFQQRPATGWGSRAQVTTPRLAARAFFGRAQHTSNPGLLDVPGWQDMSLTEAAAEVQLPRADLRGAYAQWEGVSGNIAGVLIGDLPATTTASVTTCGPSKIAPGPASCAIRPVAYNLGPVKPELARLVAMLAPMFDITTVGGYRADARDPEGHPSGRAADFMVPLSPAGKRRGDALARHARAHAEELGVDYIIWSQRIWSLDRADEGWRLMEDRGSPTQNHRDHVHINVRPRATVDTTGGGRDDRTTPCDQVVPPIPAALLETDNHNWRRSGANWSSWHTGTDYSVPCGAPVFAAHSGTIEIDTGQAWAGRWLAKVTTGADALSTWYAHMSKVTVTRGEQVRPGQQIGEVGAEGNATGCHLHFEVHERNGTIYGDDNLDPSRWLADHLSPSARSSLARPRDRTRARPGVGKWRRR